MKRPFGRAAISVIAALVVAASGVAARSGGIEPEQLRCEYVVDPLGVDSPKPRLFWIDAGGERGQKQTAFQILASSSVKLLARAKGDLWDSGRVDSGDSIQIQYGGVELKTAQQVFWKVRVWDANGRISGWSLPGTWTMGVLDPSDWRATWIAAPDTNIPSLLLRREFDVKRGLRRALVNLCGLGQYELTLNGRKCGDDLLSPGWTKYDKTCLYDTRDITSLLHTGANAVGIMLDSGMYDVRSTDPRRFAPPGFVPYSFGPLMAIAQLRLEYEDGTVDIVGTDERWRVARGPVVFSSAFDGEAFDARRVRSGWDRPRFDDSAWPRAQPVAGTGGTLRGLSCAAPPIRSFEVFKPISARRLAEGVTTYDFGQNAALMPRIAVTGPAGAVVRIVPSELVKPDGSLDDTLCGGNTDWTYTLRGGGSGKLVSKVFLPWRAVSAGALPSRAVGRGPVRGQVH